MDEVQFQSGWNLLIAQPWGKPYREGAMAKVQLTLYWKQLKQTNPVVWQAVAEYHATGEHWPSLGELKAAIKHNSERPSQAHSVRSSTIPYQDAPWPLQVVWTYQQQHDCSLKEAAVSILPQWLTENPHHEDYSAARLFLEKAQKNFGVVGHPGNARL